MIKHSSLSFQYIGYAQYRLRRNLPKASSEILYCEVHCSNEKHSFLIFIEF